MSGPATMTSPSSPSWVLHTWNDGDKYQLTKVQRDTWKAIVASVVGCRWRSIRSKIKDFPWAQEVAVVQGQAEVLLAGTHEGQEVVAR